jgi:hypothetical protein
MKGQKIKLSFCVAYDWDYLQYSLPLVYKEADEICLAVDKDRISWAGNKFQFDEQGFQLLIEKIDLDKKIKLYEDDFHIPNLSPMENEIRQRSLMANFLGSKDGWHVQLDSDEYFINFKGFVHYLQGLNPKRPINVCCPWITLYKRIDEGFLMVKPKSFKQIEFIPIATNLPQYEHGRRNGHFNHYTDFAILHQSWARSKEEVWQKLNNWGHRYDSDIEAYYKLWVNASSINYKDYINFNQTTPDAWPGLALLPIGKDKPIVELIKNKLELPAKISKIDLLKKNSILMSYFYKILNKLLKK